MSAPAVQIVPVCLPDQLRRDFGDWLASSTKVVSASVVDLWRRTLPEGQVDVLWDETSPASVRFRRQIAVATKGLSRLLLIGSSAADRLFRELSSQDPSKEGLRLLLDGHAIGDPSSVALVFDDVSHPCLGLIADATDRCRLLTQLRRVARENVPILITGETGTGKEIVARALQRLGRFRAAPWLAVNCAELSEGLLESELFGHVRGAFTGAVTSRPGLFEAADGGTLFLDEIGELPLPVQAKLLRVLEDQRVRPLGASHAHRFDCRIVAATNRRLSDAVEQGGFRRDLYHRLRSVEITLPALRERPHVLIPAAQQFLARAAFRFGRDAHLSEAARLVLTSHSWPGNFRELRQVVDAAVLCASENTLGPADLGIAPADRPADPISPLATVHALERAHILRALATTDGNRAATARLLGLTRQSLRRRMARYGIASFPGQECCSALHRTLGSPGNGRSHTFGPNALPEEQSWPC